MPWPSIFTKKTVSEPVAPVSVELPALEKVDVDPSPEPEVKKSCGCKPVACAPVFCACAPLACAPVTCVPAAWCVPLKMGSCCKSFPQSLVLRSTAPPGTEKLTAVAEVSAPDAKPEQASATEASSLVAQ